MSAPLLPIMQAREALERELAPQQPEIKTMPIVKKLLRIVRNAPLSTAKGLPRASFCSMLTLRENWGFRWLERLVVQLCPTPALI